MGNQAITTAVTGLSAAEKSVSLISGNIANEHTDGYKAFQQMLGSNANADGRSSSGVTGYIRANIDTQGSMKNTEVSTDIAINGNGMFAVGDANAGGGKNSILFARAGSFRADEKGNLSLPSGEALLGWSLDDAGNMPPGAGTTDSLSPVSIQQLVSQATATSNITFKPNLNSTEIVTGDRQVTIDIANSGSKASPHNAFIKANDVLYANPANSLKVGEGFSVTMPVLQSDGKTLKMTPTYFTYGGFSQANLLGDAGTDLVGTVTDNIMITVGNNTATLTRGAGTTNLEVMQNVVNQINNIYNTFLSARIVSEGGNSTILISPLDANQAMNFSGTGDLQSKLGLTTNTTAGANRFASLQNITDALNKITGITAKVSSGDNAGITISSAKAMYLDNYQPLGAGSDFLSEFNIAPGYIDSLYNPYDLNNNMANGAFIPAYKEDIVIYDAMGNAYNFVVSFLKIGVNSWASEVYSLDKTVINNGRTDGLVQAGIVNFDSTGKLQAYVQAVQSTTSTNILNPGTSLGATNGQNMTIQSGTTTHTFTYDEAIVTSATTLGAGVTLVGVATDTLDITVGGSTYNFARGSGTTNLAVLNDIAAQINSTRGEDALKATVKNLGAGNYALNISPADITKDITIATTALGTDLGILNTDSVLADPARYSTLYELAERINDTSSTTDSLKASVILNSAGSYQLKIEPVNPASYLTFGGTSGVINTPLGTGATDTIFSALGLQNTNAGKELAALGETVTINWSDSIKAAPNVVTINFGLPGDPEAISQINQDFIVRKKENDGAVTGELSSIEIDREGNIVANFTNGKVRKIYKIAIASFTNYNGLTAVSDTLFTTSKDSGALDLKQAGGNGVGEVRSGTLEGSNVNVADELAHLIQAQTWYQANAKVINIANSLFDELIHRTYA
ncbi:hypothetical protein I862_00065 [endosymbiont of Acanthamoeba sp. UWC8]|uniref:flagellar hook-basal body complex protein n=1 Tax=endosymbiont of Acanthamoeba sp. UWC8 TaxID=86106 RepID=UPI0004D1D010|nr:flagellar hook-basal body complex protein [endosymbiont of Acanthamoeba sp. UWC8]AIF80578.1 hypothetical protein I862_00065 [endosymbiont of Acanthamoeba sp. UWC8]